MSSDTDDIDRLAVASWLRAALAADAVEVSELSLPTSGYSADTKVVTASVTRGSAISRERFVVRGDINEPPLYPPQSDVGSEVEFQFRVMRALADHTDLALAPLLGFEPDPEVFGAPFFVMGFVDGEVPIENPMHTTAGFYVDAEPAQRRAMTMHGLEVMSTVHAVDWRRAGLGWLAEGSGEPGLMRQVDLWERTHRDSLGDRHHPLLDRTFQHLHRAVPPASGEPCLNWGDPRLGNIIWRDFTPACVTDFEAAAIAPPEMDLGWWLMFDLSAHDAIAVERLPGELTRDQQIDAYEQLAGRTVSSVEYWEVFAAARYSAIVVRAIDRMVGRGILPADNPFWLENPATVCLEMLLDR